MKTKPQIFISHTQDEAVLAATLKKHLSNDFLELFDIYVSSDKESIRAGDEWFVGLRSALEQAQVVLVLCSEDSISRPWINFEAGAAWLQESRIVPVCHSGYDPNQLPKPLSLLQGVNTSPEGIEKLYIAIADDMMRCPDVDFEQISAELAEVEKGYIKRKSEKQIIRNPRVLVAASELFLETDFHLDIEILQKNFPENLHIEKDLTSERLRHLLRNQKFDIAHLVCEFEPDAIHFDQGPEPDTMSRAAFRNLVVDNGVSLIVFGTCNSLVFCAELGPITNRVCTYGVTSGKKVAKWCKVFYAELANKVPVRKAYESAKIEQDSDNRFVLLSPQDVTFG